MVTINHLSAAPNRMVGPPTIAPKGCIRYVHFWGGAGVDILLHAPINIVETNKSILAKDGTVLGKYSTYEDDRTSAQPSLLDI